MWEPVSGKARNVYEERSMWLNERILRVPRCYKMTTWAPKWKVSAKLRFPCRVGSTTRIMTHMVVEGIVSQFDGVKLMVRDR